MRARDLIDAKTEGLGTRHRTFSNMRVAAGKPDLFLHQSGFGIGGLMTYDF